MRGWRFRQKAWHSGTKTIYFVRMVSKRFMNPFLSMFMNGTKTNRRCKIDKYFKFFLHNHCKRCKFATSLWFIRSPRLAKRRQCKFTWALTCSKTWISCWDLRKHLARCSFSIEVKNHTTSSEQVAEACFLLPMAVEAAPTYWVWSQKYFAAPQWKRMHQDILCQRRYCFDDRSLICANLH